MTLDGFLGFLGIVVAIYALLPRYRRLELKLIWRPLDWILLTFLILSIFILQFYPFFKETGLIPDLGISKKYKVYPQDISFIFLIFCPITWYLFIRSKEMSFKTLDVLRHVIDELYFMEKYDEVFLLIERVLPSLSRIYRGDFKITKFRKRLLKWNDEYPWLNNLTPSQLLDLARGLDENEHEQEKKIEKKSLRDYVRQYKDRALYSIGKALPDYSIYEGDSRDIIRKIFLDKKTISEMAKSNPYLALKFLEMNFKESEEFLFIYLAELLKNRNSILFKEIKDNRNYDGLIKMYYPKSNKLLRCILQNSSNAQRWAVYRGVGEYFIEELMAQRKLDNNIYNFSMDNFYDKKFESSLYVSLFYFDLMIREAFVNNIPWHMWLYYYNSFLRGILKNLDPEPEVDLKNEFPTRYHFLIYTMISQLTDWIGFIHEEDIDLGSENIKLMRVNCEHENNNIIKSSMICLGGCLGEIILAKNLHYEFKKYIFEVVVEANLKLMKKGELSEFASTFTECIKHGGSYVRDADEYKYELKKFFSADLRDISVRHYEEFKTLKSHFI